MTRRHSAPETPADARSNAATTREAKGSVQETIGKLIGDDNARDRGAAEKKAGAADASHPSPSPRS